MPDTTSITEYVLTDELLKLQTDLGEIEDLYKSMSEAKLLVESATAELRTRADDQWGITQKQLLALSDAIGAIEQSAKASKNLASAVGELAAYIIAVDFPARLKAIESFASEQAGQVENIASVCANLSTQAEAVRTDFADLRESTKSSVSDLGAKISSSENVLNELSSLARDLAVKVESINAAISTLASTISTLQSQLFRAIDTLQENVLRIDSTAKSGFDGIRQDIGKLKKQITLVGIGVLLNAVLVGAVLWKVFS